MRHPTSTIIDLGNKAADDAKAAVALTMDLIEDPGQRMAVALYVAGVAVQVLAGHVRVVSGCSSDDALRHALSMCDPDKLRQTMEGRP